jgi:4-hydroxy-2-oxoheptanedioate aldolase
MDHQRSQFNPLKQRLRAGRAITIVVVTIPSVAATQIWSRSGIDMLVIDMEHGPIDLTTAHSMIAATTGTDAVPLVRVPWNVPWLVKPVLDAGAMGIVFPMISGADDAEAAVRSVRYPPQGERGWGPFYAPFRWNLPLARYVDIANDEVFTLVLIERPEALEHIDEIIRVPGIDMLLIAPFDLATIMGHANEPTHPEVRRAIAIAEEKILRSGIPLGGAAPSPAVANQMIERGYRGIVVGFDWLVLQRAAAGLIDGINLSLGAN